MKCLISRLILDFSIVNEFSEQNLSRKFSLLNLSAFICVDFIYCLFDP